MRRKASHIAQSMGATADVILPYGDRYPVTFNDHDLMAKMLPTLHRTAGKDHVKHMNAVMGAEDFSFFQQKIPGLYLFVGGKTPSKPLAETAGHHTPDFVIDDAGLKLGVRTMSNLVVDYMEK